MKRLLATILAFLFFGGCGPLWGEREEDKEALRPTKDSSSLIVLRTDDRQYYYVIDKKRRLCFFHARMYGKKHLAEMDCQKLPEAEQYLGAAPVPRGPEETRASSGHPHGPMDADPGPPTAPSTAHEGAPAADPPASGLTDEVRERFRRAYVQHWCSKRSGADEPLEILLSRHGLSEAQWDQAEAEFSKDKDLWEALTAEATEACP